MGGKSVDMRQLKIVALCLALTLAATGLGCGPEGDRVGDRRRPADPDLRSPSSAVRAYLDWVSFSYRMVNSDIASATVTPYEGVRIDAYIELNRQDGRGIDQRLVSFKTRRESTEGTGAVVSAREEWEYRYFSLSSLRYTSPLHTASYDTTYTLAQEDASWRVDKVEAQALSEVN